MCHSCLQDLPFIEYSCHKCGLPTQEDTTFCGHCLTHPPKNNLAVSIFHYRDPVDHLIQKMKYHNQLEIADLMGALLVHKLEMLKHPLPQEIVPVPLHFSRLEQRGYNQAVEIGRAVSKQLKIPLNLTGCIRGRATQPQFELTEDERRKNLKGAFEVVHQSPAKHVAIIDDVMTTGSTLNELTQTLLDSGVEKVDIWTCSRATLD
ncbi:MAG: ComF family protein [Gammaproteobacteria bacterium]|nr:ComF family protein [Gammaproteobacteria bacterium]